MELQFYDGDSMCKKWVSNVEYNLFVQTNELRPMNRVNEQRKRKTRKCTKRANRWLKSYFCEQIYRSTPSIFINVLKVMLKINDTT